MSHSPLQRASKITYGVFIGQDLSHVEDAARDVRNGLATKGDTCRAIVPRPADVKLDIPAIGLVFEGDG